MADTLTDWMTILADALEALVATLHDAGVDAVVGRTGPGADVLLWPWLLEDDVRARNAPPPPRGGGVPHPPRTSVSHLRFLLIAAGEDRTAIDKLWQARGALIEHPVIRTNGGSAEVTTFPLTVSDLAALFEAASVPLALCSSFSMRVPG